VQAALDALPPDFRAAVVLCDLEGLSYEEIAATLGIKIGTVRSRIHRGRSQLRARWPTGPRRRAGAVVSGCCLGSSWPRWSTASWTTPAASGPSATSRTAPPAGPRSMRTAGSRRCWPGWPTSRPCRRR
jgi:hypothetical protein